MYKLSLLLLMILLVGCNASTGSGSDESAATTGGASGGGGGGATGGGTNGVAAGWAFPLSTQDVQYAFQGLDYEFIPVDGLGAGPWTVTLSGNAPGWLTGSVNGAGELVLSGRPTEDVGSYLPIDVTFDDGNGAGTFRFSLYVRGDKLRPYQWHLENDGVSVFSRDPGTAGEDMDVASVWREGILGAGVSIAVSDTGLEITHEDLALNMLTGKHRNYDTGTSASGYSGTPSHYGDAHGTAVTGIIGSVGWNNKGGTGIAPQARVAGFQFLDSNQTTAKYVHQASGDFDIFNYSYGTGLNADLDDDPLFIAQLRAGVTSGRSNKGQIYVKAIGNEYDYFCETMTGYVGEVCLPQNGNIPAENNSPFMILVGASNALGRKSSYSNAGSNIWVVAPGGEYGDSRPSVTTTDLQSCAQGYSTTTAGPYIWNNFETFDSNSAIFTTFNPTCSYTSVMNGSSAATPMVSGVVALMLSANPDLTWRDVKHILAVTADRIHPASADSGHPEPQFDLGGGHVYEQGWVQNMASPRRYFHNWYGFGRVNANAAVLMAIDPTYVPLAPMVETNPDFDPVLGHGEAGISAAIPDSSAAVAAAGVTRTVNINYGSLIVESVQVKLSITHPRSGQVGVELTSPEGTKSILLNINNALLHPVGNGSPDANLEVVLTTHAFYGEEATGNWQLKVIDGIVDDREGTLTDWSINLIGH